MDELIAYGGTAEGCPVCLDAGVVDLPFPSDAAALAHIREHTVAELAFALLRTRALLQHVLDEAASDWMGPMSLDHLDELMKAVDATAARSPLRPGSIGPL
ncbi:hypothetical protein ACFC58_36310 [Kitasatospora purpeofusca]|uniref:hypothetical protein n=1 Tax=Kitasatospora purpeofusca TaxID=67352 RepID=UPI0035E2955D